MSLDPRVLKELGWSEDLIRAAEQVSREIDEASRGIPQSDEAIEAPGEPHDSSSLHVPVDQVVTSSTIRVRR
jgi:hypothetical protein